MRIALGIEYDGSAYHGWQRQGHETQTVQEVLEKALSKVANHPVTVICSGRTDAGVHGLGQVVHFETTAERSDRAFKKSLLSAISEINANSETQFNPQMVKAFTGVVRTMMTGGA